MAMKLPVSCLLPFGLVAALTGCATPNGPVTDCANGARVVHSENYSTTRPATQAIQDAVKSGSFSSGSTITSSMTANVGMTVTRRSSVPVVGCP